METDGDASETPPRVVRVWIKSDEDGRVASGARVWERPLPASPEVSLVPGADGTPTDPDASAFDHAAYFDALKTRVYGRTLMTAGTLPSTQTLVQDNASAHPGSLPRGVACVADTQSGGRGRGGNQWTSPPGCLMFSLLARHPDGRTLPFIQYVATMAAVDAIQEAADQALVDAGVAGAGFRRGAGRTVDVRVKWPNDLYCGDAKIGGVLCASTYDDGGFDVVVGVGINLDNAEPTMCVNQIIAERVARAGDGSSSSTATPTATPLTRERLMASFANRFEALAGMLHAAGGFEPLEEAYLRQWLHTDQVLTLEEEGGARPRLTVKGITKTGYLLAVDTAGARYELHPDGNSLDFFKGLVRKKMQS